MPRAWLGWHAPAAPPDRLLAVTRLRWPAPRVALPQQSLRLSRGTRAIMRHSGSRHRLQHGCSTAAARLQHGCSTASTGSRRRRRRRVPPPGPGQRRRWRLKASGYKRAKIDIQCYTWLLCWIYQYYTWCIAWYFNVDNLDDTYVR